MPLLLIFPGWHDESLDNTAGLETSAALKHSRFGFLTRLRGSEQPFLSLAVSFMKWRFCSGCF